MEEEQDQPEHREQVNRFRVVQHHDPRRVRAGDDPGDDEEGDRRKPDAATGAGEEAREQQGSPQDGQLVVHVTHPLGRADVPSRRTPSAQRQAPGRPLSGRVW